MKRCFYFAICLYILCLYTSASVFAQQLIEGQGVFSYTGYEPFADRPVDVHYYIPPSTDVRNMPIIFVMEGADRGFTYLIDAWKEEAEERKFIVAVLHFDLKLYPLVDYQETGVMAEDRTIVREQPLQTSALIDQIFLYMQKHAGSDVKKYSIYGHSAGGQFIQRFMLFYDSPYVEKAIIGSPGWYTFPDPTLSFPYGVSNISYLNKEAIKKYLAKNMVLQLGMADTIRESYLRTTPEADAQGRNRLERGRSFYNYLQKLAKDNNWPCNWRKEEVEGIGHNSVEMGRKSVPILMNDSVRALFIGNSYTYYHTFLQHLSDTHPDKARFTSIGETPEGRSIPILYLQSKEKGEKIQVWIQAGLHGNEPAGPEAVCMLAEHLLNSPEGTLLLAHMNIALLPMANVDGCETSSRRSGSGLDLNRDQSKLADPISILLKQAYMKWIPDVALDIHEFNPRNKEYDAYTKRNVSIADDVLFLPTGHPCVPQCLRDFSVHVLQEQAQKALEKKGYTSGIYYTAQPQGDKLYLSKAGKSPQSSSTSFALSNALSMFIEIRGIGLERTSFGRRAESGFIVANNMLETCAGQIKQIKKVVAKAIAETQKGKEDIYVSFSSKEVSHPARFIDLQKKDTFSIRIPAFDALQNEPVITRKRPVAYIIGDTCKNSIRILETLGVKVEKTNKPLSLNVQEYTVNEYKENTVKWENIYPAKVKTTTSNTKKDFPIGTYIVYLNQRNANYATVLLEPEAENGFVAFRVIETSEGSKLPVYRFM